MLQIDLPDDGFLGHKLIEAAKLSGRSRGAEAQIRLLSTFEGGHKDFDEWPEGAAAINTLALEVRSLESRIAYEVRRQFLRNRLLDILGNFWWGLKFRWDNLKYRWGLGE